MRVKRVSNSHLKDYDSCPLLFYYRKILKLELPEKSIHLVFGSSLHKALELYNKEETDDIYEVFNKEFKEDLIDQKEKFLEYQMKGIAFLKQYTEQFEELEVSKSEEKLTFKNVLDPETGESLLFNEITGIIDFELSDGTIGDYKTSGKKYTQEQVDTSDQVTIYYLLYFLEHGKLPNGFMYIIFLKKRKKDLIQIITTQRTFEDITKLVKKLNQLYQKVEEGKFERSHGEYSYCDCFKYDELLKI